MSGGQKIVLGLMAAIGVMVCLYECCCEIVGDGGIEVAVTVDSKEPFHLRRVTYDHFGQQAAVDECLRSPKRYAGDFRETPIEGPHSFQFTVLTSEHTSPFGILKNKFSWRRFAVFRIETLAGTVHYVGAEIPDVRKTRSIAIDIP
jgi:hypothetical protein